MVGYMMNQRDYPSNKRKYMAHEQLGRYLLKEEKVMGGKKLVI